MLISTLIIESGLDIPSGEHDAREPRRHARARADLPASRADRPLAPPGLLLSPGPRREGLDRGGGPAAPRDLEHEELGAGLQIAMRDLEIRGAGNLLGPEQHGFMASVGFDLYCRMVDEVVQELQGTAVARRPEPELASDLAAFVPEEYVVGPGREAGRLPAHGGG